MVTLNLLSNNSSNANHQQQFDHMGQMQKTSEKMAPRSSRSICAIVLLLTLGLLSLILGILSIEFPLFDMILTERTKMTPGYPPYEMWEKPEPEVRLSVFIFTIENGEAFLNGTDEKLIVKEFGPIIYREILEHTNVVFHPHNSTLSYSAVRTAEYIEEANEPDLLNQTVIVPNFALLGTAAYLHDASFITKLGFKILQNSAEDHIFLNMTIYDYLWEYRSTLVQKARTLVPFMVPTENSGIMHTVYSNFVDRYNIRIGPQNNNPDFFKINTVNGITTVPGFHVDRGDCDATIINSTEGVSYGQHVTQDTVVWYWRRTLCRPIPLYFTKEVKMGSLKAYRYELRVDAYDRSPNSSADCYKGFVDELPSGLSDVSKCFFGLPFAASNPHLYGRHMDFPTKVEGLTPTAGIHESYIILEPTFGIPIDQCAKSQSNLIIPKLYGFNPDYEKFSNMVLPLFWLQYHQRSLTDDITTMLVFTVNIVPILQNVITGLLMFMGATLTSLAILKCIASQRLYINNRSPKSPLSILKTNAHHIVFEKESFLSRRISKGNESDS